MKRSLVDPATSMSILLLFAFTSEFLPASAIHAVTGAALSLFVAGHALRVTISRRVSFDAVSLQGKLAFDFALSFIIMTIFATSLALLYLLNPVTIAITLGCVVASASGLDISKSLRSINGDSNRYSPLPILLIVAVGVIMAITFRIAFTWPSMPGWDVYAHLADSNWVLAHDGLATVFPVSNGSLIPYPYEFAALVAGYSSLTGISAYTIFWLGPYISIPAYGSLVYGLATIITKDKFQSVLAALVATSISGGEVLLGPQYLFPSTAFILVFILSLVAIWHSPFRGIAQLGFSLICLGTCFLLYYYPFFLTFTPIVLTLMSRKSGSLLSRWRSVVVPISLSATILLSYVGSLLLVSGNLPFSLKLGILARAYPLGLWIFLAVGGFVIMRKFSRDPKLSISLITALAYVGTLLGLYFLPLSGSTRSELLLRPFAAIIASFGVATFVKFVRSKQIVDAKESSLPRFAWVVARAIVVIFLAASAILLVQPYYDYGQHVSGWSNISSDEYEAIQWISQNAPKGAYILSDPSSGFLVRGLTLLNSSTSFIINGQAVSPTRDPQLRSMIYGFFTTTNLSQVPAYFEQFPQVPAFIVITTRTASWASWGGINSTFPAPTVNMPYSFKGYQKFSSGLFEMTTSWQTVQIYVPSDSLLMSLPKGQ